MNNRTYRFFLAALMLPAFVQAQTYITSTGDTLIVSQRDSTVTVSVSYPTKVSSVTVKPFKMPTIPVPPVITKQRPDYDGSTVDAWTVQGTYTSYGIANVTIDGRQAIRYQLNRGDPLFAKGARSQNSNNIKTNSYPLELWYYTGYYIPIDWVNGVLNIEDIFHDWHDDTWGTTDGDELKSPFTFQLDGANWSYYVRSAGKETKVKMGVAAKGVWTNFLIHVRFVKSGNGIIEIFQDGAKTPTSSWYGAGPGYNHTIAPYYKQGLYVWGWNPQDNQKTPYSSRTINIGPTYFWYQSARPTGY